MWSIDLVRRKNTHSPPDQTIMLIHSDGQGQRVARCCEHALRLGVIPQMTLAHARALVPITSLHLAPFAPGCDDAALRSLARWAMRFSPIVAADPPDGLLLDITGCSHLFGSDRQLANAVAASLKALGIASRIAAAPTFGCAWAIARFGQQDHADHKHARHILTSPERKLRSSTPGTKARSARAEGSYACGMHVSYQSVVPLDGIRDALEPLPIAALRIDTATIDALGEVGVTRVGELFSLPRSTLPSRFGPELLAQLDRAMGEAIETIEPIRPSIPVSVERQFDGPATQIEAIEQTAHELLAALCKALHTRESGARRLTIELARSDLGPLVITITLSRASRDAAHLWPLLRPRLERADLGFGVEHVRLTAWPIERLAHTQITRWHNTQSDHRTEQELGKLLDTLTNRLGNERVTQAVFFETHLPERACRRAPATSVRLARRGSSRLAPTAFGSPRPPLLLAKPEPMDAISLTPDGPPKRLRWSEGECEVTTSIGPERIAGEWWRKNEPTRDYFAVQDDAGRWLWVYRELETGRWLVHGRWS
jgi:protein ImuB